MRRGALVGTLLMIPVWAAPATIQQTDCWGGDGLAQHLVVVDDHAFFGGATLRVADLDDAGDPVVVHELLLDDAITDLVAMGGRLFAVDGGARLIVIDAAEPGDAAITGAFDPGDPGWGLDRVAAADSNLVVGGAVGGRYPGRSSVLHLLDTSGPAGFPTALGSIVLDGPIGAIALGPELLVAFTREYSSIALGVSFPNTLRFLDVSDPSAPMVVASVETDNSPIAGSVADLAVSQGLLVAVGDDGFLHTLDVSEPSTPVFLGGPLALELGNATITAADTMLHAAGTSSAGGGANGYVLVDISEPLSPTVTGRLSGPGLASPAPVGEHVVAAAFLSGLNVISLEKPSTPRLLDVAIPARQVGAVASADRLVHVVDTTDLAQPPVPASDTLRVLRRERDDSLREIGSLRPAGAIPALVAERDVVVAQVLESQTGIPYLQVIDVSDPTGPVTGTRLAAVLSFEEVSFSPHLALTGDHLLFSTQGSNLVLIYEILDGARARWVGAYSPSAELVAFAAPSEDLLVVAVRQETAGSFDTGWVEIVDTRDPAAPQMVGSYTFPEPVIRPVGLAADRALLVVLCLIDGWYVGTETVVLDISDPTVPVPKLDGQFVFGGQWVTVSDSVYHSLVQSGGPAGPWQLWSVDLVNPAGGWINLQLTDIPRHRVDADGPYFSVSVDGRLEVHRYGPVEPYLRVLHPPTSVE
jgi:hypothetical protein